MYSLEKAFGSIHFYGYHFDVYVCSVSITLSENVYIAVPLCGTKASRHFSLRMACVVFYVRTLYLYYIIYILCIYFRLLPKFFGSNCFSTLNLLLVRTHTLTLIDMYKFAHQTSTIILACVCIWPVM